MSKVAKSHPTSVGGPGSTDTRPLLPVQRTLAQWQLAGPSHTYPGDTAVRVFDDPCYRTVFRSTEQIIQTAVATRTLKSKIWVKETPYSVKSAA